MSSTVGVLIARDEAHEMAFAKALETLGVDWGKILPIPKFDSSEYPEVKELIDAGINRQQYHFNLDDVSQLDKIYSGPAPANDGTELEAMKEPETAFPDSFAPERPEEFAPGLDPELQEMVGALNDYKEKAAKKTTKSSRNGKPK
jgi:Mn-containing catalase